MRTKPTSGLAMALLAFCLSLSSFAESPRDADRFTQQINEAFLARLPFADQADFENARRGFVATLPDALIKDANGRVVWNLGEYAFLDAEKAPPTVNPSLWRQARLNTIHGLFKVVDRIYQIRGFDIANMTIVEGDTGIIIIDPLTYTETAQAGLDLYYQHRPRKPVTAVIYTHSHADHFGGVKGIVADAEVASGKVRIIAPSGFLEEAVSENILAGNAMIRRAIFQFGSILPKGSRGQVDAGLGKSGFGGAVTLIAPTELITKPLQTLSLDGVDIVFQITPGTEAPAEMHLYFPQFRALDIAENATHTMHNLLPLRGAQVRDANAWAKYLNQALDQFGDRSDVVLAQHHWPTWGQPRVAAYLAKQRDLYKYLHDQTLRLMNHGYTAPEIAERLTLPATLEQEWSTRGLYGTLSHNVKAIYQRYLGWYDGNPAHLNPLPPTESARKAVEYMGGAQAVIARAQQDFERGEYRWVAQAMNEVVYAEPDNQAARELGASALEQLGYQAESATWRNAYLQGASELRNGTPPGRGAFLGADVIKALTVENVFDSLAIRLNGPKAEGKRSRINWIFTDTGQNYVLTLENSALTYLANRQIPEADVTVTLDRPTFNAVLARQVSFQQAYGNGQIKLNGALGKLIEVFTLLDDFPTTFPIVLPRAAGQ